MNQIARTEIETNFNRYVSAYNICDPKVALKIAHTYRVAALSEIIAQSVAPDLTELSWLCGMLHDIGRFEQIRRYHTFIDSLSIDHANFGADLLFRDGLLDQIVTLSANDRKLLELAIRNHSALRIQEELSQTEATCCNILRDADKIDIFRVNCDTPLEEIYNVSTQELKSASISPGVKACFLAKTAVPRDLRKTAVDSLVGHICLTFELVYPISTSIAIEQGYVRQLLAFQSDNPDTAAWFDYMRDHIWEQRRTDDVTHPSTLEK